MEMELMLKMLPPYMSFDTGLGVGRKSHTTTENRENFERNFAGDSPQDWGKLGKLYGLLRVVHFRIVYFRIVYFRTLCIFFRKVRRPHNCPEYPGV